MKRIILIATAAVVASIGITYAASTLLDVKECGKCETGVKCATCNGTGWKGQFKCWVCKGAGQNSSY